MTDRVAVSCLFISKINTRNVTHSLPQILMEQSFWKPGLSWSFDVISFIERPKLNLWCVLIYFNLFYSSYKWFDNSCYFTMSALEVLFYAFISVYFCFENTNKNDMNKIQYSWHNPYIGQDGIQVHMLRNVKETAKSVRTLPMSLRHSNATGSCFVAYDKCRFFAHQFFVCIAALNC